VGGACPSRAFSCCRASSSRRGLRQLFREGAPGLGLKISSHCAEAVLDDGLQWMHQKSQRVVHPEESASGTPRRVSECYTRHYTPPCAHPHP